MEDTTDSLRALSASDLFASLSQARKAGWSTRCENIGPEDWQHYGVSIYHAATKRHDYLHSRDASWSLKDARRAALARINEIEANDEVMPRPPKITECSTTPKASASTACSTCGCPVSERPINLDTGLCARCHHKSLSQQSIPCLVSENKRLRETILAVRFYAYQTAKVRTVIDDLSNDSSSDTSGAS